MLYLTIVLGLPTFNFGIPGHLNYRVTISGKAKIGTMDGHFSRDQIYGLIIFFGLTKSGRSNSALDLFIEGGDQLLQKKKKRSSPVWLHVLCHF